MGILDIVTRNFVRTPRTRQPDDLPPRPTPFRGLIEQDPALCTGCRTCEYVCAPKAISFSKQHEVGITWNFFAGQCSFCGLCVQFCPTHAITNHGKLPPITGNQLQLKVANEIRYHHCASCGKSIIPIPEETLAQVYHAPPTDLEVEGQTLCQECRRKAASRRIRDVFGRR